MEDRCCSRSALIFFANLCDLCVFAVKNRVFQVESRAYFGNARATTSAETRAAPCSFSVRAHSSIDAPVVITSSTSSRRLPLKSVEQWKAPRMFLTRSRQGNAACAGVCRMRWQPVASIGSPVARANRSGEFERLVEAALAQSFRVQRHRDDQVGFDVRGEDGELMTEETGERQSMTVLERLNQSIEREVVGKRGLRGVVMRWMGQATATDRTVRRRQCAERAAFRREARQVGGAGAAEDVALADGGAKQAILRQKSPRAEHCPGLQALVLR
jgi:hypothetical protein